MSPNEIKRTIEAHVPQSRAYVLDPMNDGQHLQAIVVSPVFEGMMLIKQHQMVMKPLKDALAGAVHALGLKTFTPQRWELEKEKYGLGGN
jgi:acid stress-induced BolA-like protein IbaG/YrbA